MSKSVKVDSIKQEDVFSKNQIVIYVSNKELDCDSLVYGKYTSTFGTLYYNETHNNFTNGYNLIGARIDENSYGQIYQ